MVTHQLLTQFFILLYDLVLSIPLFAALISCLPSLRLCSNASYTEFKPTLR